MSGTYLGPSPRTVPKIVASGGVSPSTDSSNVSVAVSPGGRSSTGSTPLLAGWAPDTPYLSPNCRQRLPSGRHRKNRGPRPRSWRSRLPPPSRRSAGASRCPARIRERGSPSLRPRSPPAWLLPTREEPMQRRATPPASSSEPPNSSPLPPPLPSYSMSLNEPAPSCPASSKSTVAKDRNYDLGPLAVSTSARTSLVLSESARRGDVRVRGAAPALLEVDPGLEGGVVGRNDVEVPYHPRRVAGPRPCVSLHYLYRQGDRLGAFRGKRPRREPGDVQAARVEAVLVRACERDGYAALGGDGAEELRGCGGLALDGQLEVELGTGAWLGPGGEPSTGCIRVTFRARGSMPGIRTPSMVTLWPT